MNALERLISFLSPRWGESRAMSRLRLGMLATYEAASKNRRTADWRTSQKSADLALIGDSATIVNRCRALVRDSNMAKAALRAFVRNVVGRQIAIVPNAVVPGMPAGVLAKFNETARRRFDCWANDPEKCDIEKRQTLWQRQQLAVAEKFTAGESLIEWDMSPDYSMKLRQHESEQFDHTKLSHIDGQVTNEVRGGVELDENAAPVAYHIYPRPLNDYTPRTNKTGWRSVRISRTSAWHYYQVSRVRQARGEPMMVSVVSRVRDFHRRDEAEMMAAVMEACIGMIITRQIPTKLDGVPGVQPAAGDTGYTPGGLRTWDLAPGMIAELLPGEDVKGYLPTRPSNSYQPFAQTQQRAIAAALGMSYEQLTRDFSQGTYSSQRQSMLEDYKEWDVEQDLLIETWLAPMYKRWLIMEVTRGELPISAALFLADVEGWSNARFIRPPRPWIDPEKEMNAILIGLQLGVVTLEEVATAKGENYIDLLRQRATEEQQKAIFRLMPTQGAGLIGSVMPAAAPGAPPNGQNGNGNGNGYSNGNGKQNGNGDQNGQDQSQPQNRFAQQHR